MRLHTTLKTLMAMMLLIPASVAAGAQYNSGESGQYRILHARYGTARHNVDVTLRLRELAQEGKTFRMGNSTFGVDPDPGTVKTLRIFARGQNGQNRMFEYREGSVVDGAMFADWSSGQWGNGGWNGGWDNENGDSGQYQILQARYGTARHNVDVTQRLRELAQQDITFRMGNSTFGVDPDPGTVKTLRIYARGPNGQNRMFEYREGSVVDGAMFTGWSGGRWGNGGWNGGWESNSSDSGQYQILQARYGTARHNVDVTQRLRELAQQDITFRMGNSTFGVDPDPGTVKTLRIYARDPNGQNRMFEYREGSVVDGSMFTGWAGGRWGNGGWNGGRGNDSDRGGRGDFGRLTIVQATYGTGNRQRDVTGRLQSLVRDGQLVIIVSNDLMGGDPAPGRAKTLWVTYTSGRGRQQQVRVNEGEQLRIP